MFQVVTEDSKPEEHLQSVFEELVKEKTVRGVNLKSFGFYVFLIRENVGYYESVFVFE